MQLTPLPEELVPSYVRLVRATAKLQRGRDAIHTVSFELAGQYNLNVAGLGVSELEDFLTYFDPAKPVFTLPQFGPNGVPITHKGKPLHEGVFINATVEELRKALETFLGIAEREAAELA